MTSDKNKGPLTRMSRDEAEAEIQWHSWSNEEIFHRLETDGRGLDQVTAEERLREYGLNTLPSKPPPTLLKVILHQFTSPLIYILLIAGGVSLLMGDLKDALFIFLVIFINAAIGTWQEWRAEQSAHALQSMLEIQTRVKRSAETITVSASQLVPGDVILIESGDKVPADIRLLQETNLSIDESFLTGESLPVDKKTGPVGPETLVSDRINMGFAGSTVISGRGQGMVVATGSRTEVGKIARSITEVEGAKPPLVIRMERFARQIGLIVIVFAALLGALSISRGMAFHDVFLVMIAMAVSAIPEGLPVAMTVALSLATSRMAARKVIARKLVAVEGLGSCTTIASDKTGTFTVNQQTVKRIVLPDNSAIIVSGQGYNDQGVVSLETESEISQVIQDQLRQLGRASVLCNEGSLTQNAKGWTHSGDSMDIALLALAYKLGLSPAEERQRTIIISEIPFESERRYAAVSYQSDQGPRIIVKGAMEAVLPFCSRMMTLTGDVTINREDLALQANKMAEGGYRVLMIAEGPHPEAEFSGQLTPAHMHDLTVLGLTGFMDPLRAEVKDAVTRAGQAQVKVIMITGDHPATALAIAKELNIASSEAEVITGGELTDALEAEPAGSAEFQKRLKNIRVFARVTPQQKMFIVDTLMLQGEFVAVTGDGVNDAPALNRANIGVAMGSGTEVAKDAAQIIVTDDNFASIVNGIEEGRFAYANVRKVTLFLISTGFAELVLIGIAILVGMPVPFLAVQLLWLNLVTNGIQDVALAFEAGEKGVMRQPPRSPHEGIFNRKMIEQVLVSGFTMALICLSVLWYMLGKGLEETEVRNILLTLMILLQFFHVMNCRSEYASAFRIPFSNNYILILGMILAFAIHLAATHWPVTQSLLRITPLSTGKWLSLGCCAALLLPVMETYKFVRRSHQPQ